MTVPGSQVLDRLSAEEPCFGALFLTYAFDPAFFEEHVLRTVLRLSSDPTEQPTRYHDEAIRALQTTPVAVVADAGVRQGGRRLPYDILEVSARVFHPKLAISIYERFARIHVGSGNLTPGGYGGNAELFMTMDLAYDDPSSARSLSELLECVERATEVARRRGTQLGLFMEELRRRLPGLMPDAEASIAWLDSTRERSILDQAVALLPRDAVVRRVGIMAPFFERDDTAAAESLNSVFGRLRGICGADAHLDVGVLWDNPSVQPEGHTTKIEDRLNALWAWRGEYEDSGDPGVEYLVPTHVARTRLHYLDESGRHQSWPLEGVRAALEDHDLWPLAEPIVFAPPSALESAREAFGSMQLWLHPSTRLVEGRPLLRPLHAKLLLVAYETAGRPETLVVLGSANASRTALLLPTAKNGNVELCLAFRVARTMTLPDLAPELVACPQDALSVREREFPELSTNFGLFVTGATYDAAARTLVVEWANDPSLELRAWSLSYRDGVLATGEGIPSGATVITEFDLHRSSAELTLVVGDAAYPIPILVVDLVALPAGPGEDLLGLHELLLLLGRRMGTERLLLLAQQRGASVGAADGALDDVFGAGFGPTDVFKAWWNVAAELAEPETSVAAFRLRLHGSLGLAAVWTRMLEGARSGAFSPDTIWFYGAELLRELSTVRLSGDASGVKKREFLEDFQRRLAVDLEALVTPDTSRPWLGHIRSFYGVAP